MIRIHGLFFCFKTFSINLWKFDYPVSIHVQLCKIPSTGLFLRGNIYLRSVNHNLIIQNLYTIQYWIFTVSNLILEKYAHLPPPTISSSFNHPRLKGGEEVHQKFMFLHPSAAFHGFRIPVVAVRRCVEHNRVWNLNPRFFFHTPAVRLACHKYFWSQERLSTS